MKKTIKRWRFKAGRKNSTAILGTGFVASLILTSIIITMLLSQYAPEAAAKISENSITGFIYAGSIIGMPCIIVCVIVMRILRKLYITDYTIETDGTTITVKDDKNTMKLLQEKTQVQYKEKIKGGRTQVGALYFKTNGKIYNIIARCDIFGRSKEIDIATMKRIAKTLANKEKT